MSPDRPSRPVLRESHPSGTAASRRPPRLLLLLPTNTYRAAAYLDAAVDLGIEVVIGAPFRAPLGGAGTFEVPSHDLDAAVEAIEKHAAETPFDAVFGVDELMAKIAAHAAVRLGLAANPTAAVETLCDKLSFREFQARHALAHPDFWEVYPNGRPVDGAAFPTGALTFPWVLKPRTLRGSRGVIRVDKLTDSFGPTAARIARIQTLGMPPKTTPPTLVLERFLPGTEVALEGLVVHGKLQVLVLFDKPGMSNGPYFEETVYVAPSRLPRSGQLACVEAVQALVTALELTQGPIHAELRCHRNQATVIEMAPRTIGGQCAMIIRLEDGRSLESLVLQQAAGFSLPAIAPERRPVGVMMIPIPGPGRLVAVSGVPAARHIPGVRDISITAAPGCSVSPPPEGGDYLGFIFAEGASPSKVETSLHAAHRELKVVIDN